ncbi:hypothetical protein FLAG1_06381 [Fusarium langsethiae]|uniref:Uncharacterized protein n=1 Tax=Fusarium langsethiae TaxID=179993 RepID=A0A0M9EVY1_FUSLA|nr:hypothetical protein FLAG1_06381 [Fusarium langsethiae]GKU03862.1 unnamed protein product [Fusarium langsethiae]GKU18679.1 unnamed protein product [Fusarium langsethiae]
MHSAIFALFAISGLAAATPNTKPQTECEGLAPLGLDSVKYYVCGKNGFRGYCSEDPCDAKWCRDFAPKTCDLVFITEPEAPVVANPTVGGDEEDCETATATATAQATSTDLPTGQCAPGTGFFQNCSNGFRGCCKNDACSQSQPICPSSPAKRSDDPTVCPPGTGFFQSCSNGFRGCCKGDACGNSWCPDYKTGTYQPAQSFKVKARSDGTCAPGTGYFQVCSNGFKGCCKKDACGQNRPVCPK